MFKQLAARRRNRRIRDDFYGRIVALSRHPVPYANWGVPDSLEGRLEMLILCLFLVLERLRRAGSPGAPLAQELMDAFFADMDAAHRQLGVGDLKVPRRMRELAGLVETRLQAYRGASVTGGRRLSRLIAENFAAHPGAPRVRAAAIASCATALLAAMERVPVETLMQPGTALAPLADCRESPS